MCFGRHNFPKSLEIFILVDNTSIDKIAAGLVLLGILIL